MSRVGLAARLTLAFLLVSAITLSVVLFGIEQATRGSFDAYVRHAGSMRSMMGGGLQAMPDGSSFTNTLRWSVTLGAAGGVLLSVALGVVLARWIARPVREVQAAAERVAHGDTSARVPPGGGPELSALASTFNGMAAELADASDSRKRFLADVAHELRTPLSVLRGELEAIQDGVVEPDAGRVQSLLEETELLTRLVEDLRTLSLVDAGGLSLALTPAPLAPVLERAVQAMAEGAARRGVSLTMSLRGPLGTVAMDEQRVEQALRNLLSNGIRHAAPHGWVSVSAEQTRGAARVLVEDNGSGIPPEALGHVFDRFYRADPSRSRESGGSGLGLAIVRSLVEAHGGTVGAWNRREGGAAFEFALPTRTPASVAATASRVPTAQAVQP